MSRGPERVSDQIKLKDRDEKLYIDSDLLIAARRGDHARELFFELSESCQIELLQRAGVPGRDGALGSAFVKGNVHHLLRFMRDDKPLIDLLLHWFVEHGLGPREPDSPVASYDAVLFATRPTQKNVE